jgi:hypothetical protein
VDGVVDHASQRNLSAHMTLPTRCRDREPAGESRTRALIELADVAIGLWLTDLLGHSPRELSAVPVLSHSNLSIHSRLPQSGSVSVELVIEFLTRDETRYRVTLSDATASKPVAAMDLTYIYLDVATLERRAVPVTLGDLLGRLTRATTE